MKWVKLPEWTEKNGLVQYHTITLEPKTLEQMQVLSFDPQIHELYKL